MYCSKAHEKSPFHTHITAIHSLAFMDALQMIEVLLSRWPLEEATCLHELDSNLTGSKGGCLWDPVKRIFKDLLYAHAGCGSRARQP